MDFQEYVRKTQHAVDLVNALNPVVGTGYNSVYAQTVGNTDELVQALRVFQTHIGDTISELMETGREYKEHCEYRKFVEMCSGGECDTVAWSDIPTLARAELMPFHNGCDSLDKAIEWFKSKYGIKHITV